MHTPQVGEQDTVRLSVTITNIGDMAGEEIVQLYIGYQNSAVLRHEKDLRAFQKVTLPPKASLSVGFSLPVEKLAYWDTRVQDWKVEHISYTALVGPSSRKSDLLSSQFSVG
jgi:beta-glucosidase